MLPRVSGSHDSTVRQRPQERGQRSVRLAWDGGVASYPLPDQGELVLGRDPACGIVIDDPSVSRRHCRLLLGEEVEVEDLGSTNGTSLEGQRLSPGSARRVATGRAVSVGGALLLLDGPARAEPAPAESAVIVPGSALARAMDQVARYADSDLPILVTGSTGAGKEVIALRLQQASRRAGGPFVRLNCATLPESLVEAELFGHEKGAFTGATHSRPGLFELANGGTLYLDEIGELPLLVQPKLLRAMEAMEITRIGGRAPKRVDVRLVAATNRDLAAAIAQGKFRSDLYYRIAGAVIEVPGLSQRRDEILPLASWFLARATQRHGRAGLALSEAAEAALLAHPWPGNVRELRYAVERAVLAAEGAQISAANLGLLAPAPPPPTEARAGGGPAVPPEREAGGATGAASGSEPPELRDHLRAEEHRRIAAVLGQCGGNQSRAAQMLGISRSTLLRRLAHYKVPRPRG